MLKNYSLYMLGAFLGIGLLIGLIFAGILQILITLPDQSLLVLYSLAAGAGLFSGAVTFLVNYSFIRSIISHFREVLALIHEEDYSARVNFSEKDMIGLLADDVNCALEHLEEKNDEALHDELTGLPNRQFLNQHYRKNFSRLVQNRTAFLFFDLDKFKDINDQFGHLYGDRVLVSVADRVRSALVEDEVLVRLSGDEFLLVAKLPKDCSGKEFAEQLTDLFTEPLDIHETFLQVQTSVGVSIAPMHGTCLNELIRKADFAMYEAKKTEGSSYYLFEERLEKEIVEIAKP